MSEHLGRYVLEQKLGEGGMAEVWLATQLGPTGFRRRCVVKRVLAKLAEDKDLVRMFLDEARLAAQLNHPNIIQILDFGEHEGAYFIAMELVEGKDLRYIVRTRAPHGLFIAFPVAARIVSLIAQALDSAHHAISADGVPLKLVHRDVTPHNILISTAGQVKLIDFGIAKAANASHRTKTGFVKGKFSYMSPEQLRGEPLDGRSDLFALGLVFWELLAGRPALPREGAEQAIETILRNRIAPIDSVRSGIPGELLAALARCLQPAAADRYARGLELSNDLERYILSSGVFLSPSDISALIPPGASSVPFITSPEIPISDAPLAVDGRSNIAPQGGVLAEIDPAAPDAPRRPPPPVPVSSLRPSQLGLAPIDVPSAAEELVPDFPTAVDVARAETPATVGAVAAPSAVPGLPLDVRRLLQRIGIGVGAVAVLGVAVGVGRLSRSQAPPPPAPVLPALPPAPPPINLILRSEVPARVSIDGEVQGVAPVSVGIKPGEHTVAYLSDALDAGYVEQVVIVPGQSREVTWHPRHARLLLAVAPKAEVFLDGSSVGTTPLPPLDVFEGQHSLRLANVKTGKTVRRELRLSPGEERKLRITLPR